MTYLELLMILIVEVGSRYMVPKVPVLVLEASVGSDVLDKVLLRGVHLHQVRLIDLNHLVLLAVTQWGRSMDRCYRWSHLGEDHHVVFRHI